MKRLFSYILFLIGIPVYAQTNLLPIAKIAHSNFPCCVSGIEKKDDSTYYLVSDVKNQIFVARFDKRFKSMKVVDVLNTNLPGKSGLESVRLFDQGKRIMVTLETDTLTKCVNAKLLSASLEKTKLIFSRLPVSECYLVMRDNSGIEGLSFTADGKSIWVVNERAYDTGTLKDKILFERYELNKTLEKKEQFEYKLDPCPTKVADADNGISEILVYNKDSMLVMERAYDSIAGSTTVKIFWLDLVTQKKISSTAFDTKIMLENLLDHIDNYEGMCFGPDHEGHKTIFIISDNNDKVHQSTDIVWIDIL